MCGGQKLGREKFIRQAHNIILNCIQIFRP